MKHPTTVFCSVVGSWLLLTAAALAQAEPGSESPPAVPSAPDQAAPAPQPVAAEPPATDPEAIRELAPPPPPAANDSVAPPENNPYVYARGHQRWTQADLDRVRAALAAQRAARKREDARPIPRVYGNAGAPLMFGFDVAAVFRDDVGFSRFENGDVGTRLGFFASYDVLSLAPKLVVSAELGAGFEHERSPGLIGPSSSAELDTQTLHAGVDLRWDALTFLSPMLRAWGGASLLQLELSATRQTFDTSHASSGFAALGGALLVHTPARTFESRSGQFASFGLGLIIEGGYALRSPVDFSLHAPSQPRNIPVVDAALGRLDLSGPYIRTAFIARF